MPKHSLSSFASLNFGRRLIHFGNRYPIRLLTVTLNQIPTQMRIQTHSIQNCFRCLLTKSS